jgi:hypothetical protein
MGTGGEVDHSLPSSAEDKNTNCNWDSLFPERSVTPMCKFRVIKTRHLEVTHHHWGYAAVPLSGHVLRRGHCLIFHAIKYILLVNKSCTHPRIEDGHVFLNILHRVQLFVRMVGIWPALWYSGQSSWLQTQRSRLRFPALPDFLRSSGSETGTIQPREDNWGATWMEK